MVMQLTGAIVNIILDPIMIFGLLGCPAMGISGAAIATVIGQFCGLGVGIVCNQLKNRELRLSLHGFRIHPRAVKDILAVGFPSMIMQSISSVLTVLMNMILIAYGNVAVSVLGVYFKLQSFVFMPVFGLNNGLVAIVGYTNAGKSTLLNQLTGAGIPANNRLFDTLDTTSRLLTVSDNLDVILSDTVGFIAKLPHHLVDAFRATLEELEFADLLLHVIDASDPHLEEHIAVVDRLISQLAKPETPVLKCYNTVSYTHLTLPTNSRV